MTFRKLIFWVHLSMGITVGMMVLVIAGTGMMLAFKPQVLNMIEGDLRFVAVEPNIPRLSQQDLLQKARDIYPNIPIKKVVLKPDPRMSAIVKLGKDQGLVFLNPYTGQWIGKETQVTGYFRSIESMHRWFALKGTYKSIGQSIKNWSNVMFLGMIVSGLYVWWPFKSTWFKHGLKGRARAWNWHTVLGFWSAPWLFVLSFSGAVLSFWHAKNIGWVKTVHTGEVGGIVGQIVAFCASFCAIILVVTGMSMACRRLFKSKR